MDGQLTSIDAILANEKLSTKKEAKKTEVQKPIANSSIDQLNSRTRVARPSSPQITGVEGQSETTNKQQESRQQTIDQSALAKAERRSRRLKTLEIDDYLMGLVMEGLLDENFIPWAAKCCITLGLQKVNTIVLNVRQTTKVESKQKLLAWKLRGALDLHHRKAYYASIRDNGEA